ncbi:molybdenum cofactor guanylyltransferase [Pedobacter sp. MC2016-14]|uniref:molybdenum cofactor guanylyltransferase n=1 Tax=Pedobacter sp. MC2016-14 TaxID=2897327 RepID=UPI001E6530A1|nr:molybdenum cofactor guanylyltransferase [Pedobacter sp. MC2016-14]MCD0489132.1 molybdenum cofactor guanylyltransferase [Pedobacter sp. MC2016-14]
MLGIVLCGGQSSRMGTDKGLLRHEGHLWANLAANKLQTLNISVKLSVNDRQQEMYSAFFDQEDLITDHAELEIKGPLLGLLSAHKLAAEQDLFVLACDLLYMEGKLMEKLRYSFNSHPGSDAYLFTKNGRQEPMFGIYTAKALKKALQMYQAKTLDRHSMKFILAKLNVFEIELEEMDYPSFRNLNTNDDLKGF